MTGVQTCALPISRVGALAWSPDGKYLAVLTFNPGRTGASGNFNGKLQIIENATEKDVAKQIGRASCRERV